MANLITHKRSSVPAAVPAPGDLALGEIALNTTDKLLYIKDGSNNIVALNDSDNVVEGTTNLFFSDTRARNAISVTDVAGDGALSYNPTTGVFTYAGISDAQVRSKLSVTGDLTYDPGTGVFGVTVPATEDIRGLFSATGSLSYSPASGEFSFTERTDAGVRTLISASGDISYNNGTGVISYTKQTPAQLLTAVKTVDGDTSGLDSDLLDGQHGAYYLDYANATNKPQIGTNWSTQTTAYTAVANDGIAANTQTSGAFTITLPATPSVGDTIIVVDASDFASDNCTINRNGQLINAVASNLTLSTAGTYAVFTYTGATRGWSAKIS